MAETIKNLFQSFYQMLDTSNKWIRSLFEKRRVMIYYKDPETNFRTDLRDMLCEWDFDPENTLKEMLQKIFKYIDRELSSERSDRFEFYRLVVYDGETDEIKLSLEDMDFDSIKDVVPLRNNRYEMLLEIRRKDDEFEVYEAGGFTIKVFKLSWIDEVADIEGPVEVQAYDHQTVLELKNSIKRKKQDLDEAQIFLAAPLQSGSKSFLDDRALLKDLGVSGETKVFMTSEMNERRFMQAVHELDNIWVVYFPMQTEKQENYGEILNSSSQVEEDDFEFVHPQPTIDSPQKYFKAAVYNRFEGAFLTTTSKYIENKNILKNDKILKVFVDRRMSVETFISNLQPFTTISHQRLIENKDLNISLVGKFIDKENLERALKEVVEFGRTLKEGEFVRELYYMNLSHIRTRPFNSNESSVGPYILRKNENIGQTKRNIIKFMRNLYEDLDSLTYERTRLRTYHRNKFFQDSETFSESFCDSWKKIYIQEIESEDKSYDDLESVGSRYNSFFVRRVEDHHHEIKLGKYEEILVGGNFVTYLT